MRKLTVHCLPMFKTLLKIHLMPQQVTLTRSRRWQQEDGTKPSEINTHEANEHSQEWAIEACRKLLGQDSDTGNLHITYSDLWARYDLIQLGEAALGDEDALSLARAQFSRHYPGADSASWPLRVARQGKKMLVAGMNPSLLTAVKLLAVESGKCLVRAEPLFAKVLDQYEKVLTGTDGWILLDEPGMLIAAFMERGHLFSIHSQRNDEVEREKAVQLLLDRQAALISRPAGEVRIFSYSGIPLALQNPWRISQFCIIGHTSATPSY